MSDWADDGRIYVQKPTPGQAVLRLVTLDPVTGRQQPWRDLSPQDTTGVHAVRSFRSVPATAPTPTATAAGRCRRSILVGGLPIR